MIDAKPDQYMEPDFVRSKMDIPPQLKAAYEKIVSAGITGMFAPQFRKATLAAMDDAKGDPDAMGQQMAALMFSIVQRSNNTLPPQLMTPAGIELMAHAAQVARVAGHPLDANGFAEAVAAMVEHIFKTAGVKPEEVAALVAGGAA